MCFMVKYRIDVASVMAGMPTVSSCEAEVLQLDIVCSTIFCSRAKLGCIETVMLQKLLT